MENILTIDVLIIIKKNLDSTITVIIMIKVIQYLLYKNTRISLYMYIYIYIQVHIYVHTNTHAVVNYYMHRHTESCIYSFQT